ncbi:MAG: CDP-diacylglycerol--glycerol-3-phosphate 3-phosphatidyltransferase [Lachnospiraceae bacterium]|nr:CDP-diacylglycerol--glycerol-3-phosphate 3-phosphatidyltransferase [Lachnospiraceae bacterium]
MNLPNKLTILRVLLIPFFVVAMLVDGIPYNNYIAGIVFCVACLTDALDGHIARKNHLITNFGKFMDPLADKLLVCAALICFVAMPELNFPAWAAIVIISREFVISGFRLVASDNGVVIAASKWGKFKTISQMIMSILLIFHLDVVPYYTLLEQISIYLSVILTVVSLVDYIYKNKEVLKEEK